jgi:hypothetical protein
MKAKHDGRLEYAANSVIGALHSELKLREGNKSMRKDRHRGDQNIIGHIVIKLEAQLDRKGRVEEDEYVSVGNKGFYQLIKDFGGLAYLIQLNVLWLAGDRTSRLSKVLVCKPTP